MEAMKWNLKPSKQENGSNGRNGNGRRKDEMKEEEWEERNEKEKRNEIVGMGWGVLRNWVKGVRNKILYKSKCKSNKILT